MAIAEAVSIKGLIYAVAAAAIIGGGAEVLNNQSRIAVLESTNSAQDTQLNRIEAKMDVLLERIQK